MSNKKLSILLAESDSGEATPALRKLYPQGQEGLELTVVSSVVTLLATLEIVNPEVIFFDLSLGGSDPLGEVRRIHRAAPAVPLIVLANSGDMNLAARSLSQGALNYLMKGLTDPLTLERVLREALEQNTLGGLADLLRDSDTGLYTRDGFLTLGERAMEAAKRRQTSLVLLCIRIENLAALHMEYGPSALERALGGVVGVLAGSFRGTDILARLGESQFAALAVNASESSVAALCERVAQRLALLNQERGPSDALELRMSVRSWSAKEAVSFSEFLDGVELELRVLPTSFVEIAASSEPANSLQKE
jgi:diguanylate cyclase